MSTIENYGWMISNLNYMAAYAGREGLLDINATLLNTIPKVVTHLETGGTVSEPNNAQMPEPNSNL